MQVQPSGGPKICAVCGQDATTGQRIKDRRGRIFHKTCYERAKQKAQARSRERPETVADNTANPPVFEELALLEASASSSTSTRCPACGANLAMDARICVNCGLQLATGKKVSIAKPKKTGVNKRSGRKAGSIVMEVGVFSVGIGCLFSILAAFILKNLSDTAPPFMGLPRRLGLGLPILIVAVFNVLAGVVVFVRKSSAGIALSMVAAISIPVLYAGIMIVSGVGVRFSCMTILMILIPIAVVHRGKKALGEIQEMRKAK